MVSCSVFGGCRALEHLNLCEVWLCSQFLSHPSQKREGWGTRAFVAVRKIDGWEPGWAERGLTHPLRYSCKGWGTRLWCDVDFIPTLATMRPSRRWGTRICARYGCADSFHPTLRRSAKDGAPELLWRVEKSTGWNPVRRSGGSPTRV